LNCIALQQSWAFIWCVPLDFGVSLRTAILVRIANDEPILFFGAIHEFPQRMLERKPLPE
jgi:hypothetical protein